MPTNEVYSEFELAEMGIKFENDPSYTAANCTGSCEEELDARVVTKKCRGVVAKKVVRGTGTGKLVVSMHCPISIYDSMFGLKLKTLIEGVKGYGQNSKHGNFSITQKVLDEDGVVKFKAYPNCVVETGVKRKIENGAEEVAEIELEISVMPDEYGQGMYEALESELGEGAAKTTWMTAFTPEMVQAPGA